MSDKIVLITGASGFIGKALVQSLCANGYTVRATVRSEHSFRLLSDLGKKSGHKLTVYNLGNLSTDTEWTEPLKDVETVVHCAARAHVLKETSPDPLASFRQINCNATEHLANAAYRAGIKRFIFLSSIGVLGNCSNALPFTESSNPNPQVPYAQAKLEAEHTLNKLSKKMELVIIRPPLIYGPGVKGNFEKLLALVGKNVPLPFGRLKNRRQFLGINNLIDFITVCIESPKAANQIFLVADKEVISTTELIQIISKLMGKKNTLLPVSPQLLQWILRVLAKEKVADQLLNNLEITLHKAKEVLDWEPPYSMLEQLQNTVLQHQSK